MSARDQRLLRKKWRENARKRREVKKIQRQTQKMLNEETAALSPIPLNSPSASLITLQPSTSRVSSWKAVVARNRRILKSENMYLRQRLQALENK
ncbi:unnamed protein product [Parnassius apollo]|uniref:(apollo) hypothetical protein n=1 Tax=Parnassius apollo TaxID=110799 RepID=A0A8S3XG99_PARAO|nr:unnamed protein product [Parnassius apollo]